MILCLVHHNLSKQTFAKLHLCLQRGLLRPKVDYRSIKADNLKESTFTAFYALNAYLRSFSKTRLL